MKRIIIGIVCIFIGAGWLWLALLSNTFASLFGSKMDFSFVVVGLIGLAGGIQVMRRKSLWWAVIVICASGLRIAYNFF